MHKLQKILKNLQQGKFIILEDDAARENEADLVIAAEHLTAETLNFMLREAGGFICVAMNGALLDKLAIPAMVRDNNSQFSTPFTVSVEAATGVTTGVSVADRLHTIKTLIAADAKPSDIVMPGHIMPLRAHPQGVLARGGHTEGSVDLIRLAGLTEAAVICELMNPDGSMMRGDKLKQFAECLQIPRIDIAAIRAHRLAHENVLQELARCHLPVLEQQPFQCRVYQNTITDEEHVALISENCATEPVVRIHSQCLTGDVFKSNRCDCGAQLEKSLQQVADENGILLYLAQEGRGIGLANKIKSYALQEQGLDSVEANHALGFADDLREYYVAAHILKELNIEKVRLLTNNPRKIAALEQLGIQVAREPLTTTPTAHNREYLLTKQNKLEHMLNLEK